jgi:two-component system chemotaxis response regulator CheY
MKKILIVDDSPIVREYARRILEELSFQTSDASDGQMALQACGLDMPDAILLDWHMPILDGLGFIKSLRKMPEGSHPKVVFCTTENNAESIAIAINAGANEFIMKPFDKLIMQSKLEEIGLI